MRKGHKRHLPDKKHPAELTGVDGWLALLCFFLFCFMPILIVYGDIRFLQIVTTRYDHLSIKGSLLVLELLTIDCLRATLAILAGIGLWRVWRHAVLFAQLVLFMGPLVYFLDRWLVHSGVDPQVLKRSLPAVWILYLEGSRRVRSTFGAVYGDEAKLSLLDYLVGNWTPKRSLS